MNKIRRKEKYEVRQAKLMIHTITPLRPKEYRDTASGRPETKGLII
jgi:hypothetical protein